MKSAMDLSSAWPRHGRRSWHVAWRLSAVVLACGLAGCGLRSDADDEDSGGEGTFGGDTEADPRRGSCDTPYMLPFANFEARGRLAGPGKVRGWCGRVDAGGGPDAGPEDSYVVTPSFDVDVTVLLAADFDAALRVTRDGCREDVLPAICAAPIGDRPWHFFAEVGHEYTITVDSPAGTDGRYTMQVIYGDPGPDACPLHPSQIDQEPGGFFTWSNSFGKRQGQVDGACGGPGTENMFQLNVSYPGNITFRLTADDRFEPVLSVRSGCGGVTELQCTSAAQTGSGSLELTQFFEVPGTYFVVVDQGNIEGGDYHLEVFSE